jgi:hypothetical protein
MRFALALVCLSMPLLGAAQWVQQPQFHTTNTLFDVRLNAAERGIVVGEGNVLLCTLDGGLDWDGTGSADPDLITAWLQDGVFYFANVNGALFREDNPATCDNELIAPSISALNGTTDWQQVSGSTGWLAANGRVWYSDNAWSSLTAVDNIACPVAAKALFAYGDTLAFAAGMDGRIIRIRRLGGTFVCDQRLGGASTFRGIHGFEDRLVAAGDNGSVWQSNNAGLDWSAIPIPGGGRLESVHVRASGVYAAGENGVYFLPLADTVWLRQSLPFAAPACRSIWFIDDNRGWLVGDGGFIARTDNGGGSGEPVGWGAVTATSASVGPNPFHDRLMIIGSGFAGTAWTLYHTAGQRMAEGTCSPGGVISLPDLPAGMYVFRLGLNQPRMLMREP